MRPATRGSSVVHLNVVDFPAAVAIAKDRSLADKAFIIAGASSARAVVLGLSRRARDEGLAQGMALAQAERRVPGILVLSPDSASCAKANEAMELLASRYAPLVQNDSGGHLYLDLAGTKSLFGAYVDSAVRIRNEIVDALGIEPAVAVASNKLVTKVATRSIRPAGIAYIREGEELEFLSPQDALLLPGMGSSIARVLSVTGIREIGELASLTREEAHSLFGARGIELRDAARGIDDSPVVPGSLAERAILRQLDFALDELDSSRVRAALISLVEDAGLELRKSKLVAKKLRLGLAYSDGFKGDAEEKSKRGFALDSELLAKADAAFARANARRVRLRGIALRLAGLEPALMEQDLFVPEGIGRLERIQAAVDASRLRFGVQAITLGSGVAVESGTRSAGLCPQGFIDIVKRNREYGHFA